MKFSLYIAGLAFIIASCSTTRNFSSIMEDDIYYVPGKKALAIQEVENLTGHDIGTEQPVDPTVLAEEISRSAGSSTPPATFSSSNSTKINARSGQLEQVNIQNLTREAEEKLANNEEIDMTLYENTGYWIGGYRGPASDLAEIQRIINMYPEGFANFSNGQEIALNLSFDSDWNVYTDNGRYWWFPSNTNINLYSSLLFGTYPKYIWTIVWNNPRFDSWAFDATFNNRFNWSLNLGWGGPGWSIGFGWNSGWYDPWYGGWYDPWYHPWYGGLRLNEDLRSVKEMEYIGKLEEGNESGTINVMKLRGRIVFSDGSKFYTYEDLTGKIVPYDLLNEDFPELSDTYRVVSLNNDLYWFIRNSEYVLLGYESGRFQLKQRIPFTLFDNPTIEDRGNIYVASDGTSYFCLNGGIARYDRYRNYVDTTRVPLSLSQVRAYNRHENEFAPLPCKGADAPEAGASALSYSYNTILFKFSYPDFTGRRFLIYYKLDGFDNEWIEGTSNFQRTYSNLPYGNFVLHAVVKDDRGKELSSLSYPFKIERPFYSSWWALIIYFALFLCILVVLVRMYTMWIVMREKKVNEEQKRLQEEQLRAQEQLIVKLENEKLENDLTYKSKELASATLSVISHNDFLEGLKKEIQAQQLSGSYTKRFFDKLIRMIEENISGEDEWAIFQTNFDRIHEKFFTNLKERYPDLTPGDLRLCALLRLNMPTKDMARMQNLSVRGIEAARYRLRKKLNLPEGQSLVDFMIQFH